MDGKQQDHERNREKTEEERHIRIGEEAERRLTESFQSLGNAERKRGVRVLHFLSYIPCI